MDNIRDIFNNAVDLDSRATSGKRGGPSVVSINIVCAGKNGNRVKLSVGLYEALGRPEYVGFKAINGSVFVYSESKSGGHSYKLNEETLILYNSGLVHKLVDYFKLDFSARKSMSFNNAEILEIDNVPVVKISIN